MLASLVFSVFTNLCTKRVTFAICMYNLIILIHGCGPKSNQVHHGTDVDNCSAKLVVHDHQLTNGVNFQIKTTSPS